MEIILLHVDCLMITNSVNYYYFLVMSPSYACSYNGYLPGNPICTEVPSTRKGVCNYYYFCFYLNPFSHLSSNYWASVLKLHLQILHRHPPLATRCWATTIILWITFELCPFLDSVRYTNCLSILLHQHNHFSRSGLSSVLCWIPRAVVVVDWNSVSH